jgi:parvulin-like peptidyl-prolyl isomerase
MLFHMSHENRRRPTCLRRAAIVGFAAMLALPAFARAQPVRDIGGASLENAIVASVAGRPITLRDLIAYETGRAQLLPIEQRADRYVMLEALIAEIMFDAEFVRNGIRAEDSDVADYIDRLLAQTGSTEEQVRAALERLNLPWSAYFERMRREVQRLALVNRVIRSRVNVSPEEVKREWKSNPEYETPDQVNIAHIFMPYDIDLDAAEMESVEQRVQEAFKKAKDNFGKAAALYSAGPTAENGGELGNFARGSMSPLFEREVDKLKEGEVSKPFQAEGAFHILKLRKVLPPSRIPLATVEAEIREQLYNQHLEERFLRWTNEDLRKRYHVTMHYDRVAALL